MIKRTPLNEESLIEYLIGALFVYCNGSWVYLSYKTPMIVLLILSLILFLIYNYKKNNELTTPNGIIIFLALFPVLCCLVNIDNNANFVSVANISTTYLLLGCLPLNRLKSLLNKYANIIYFLAVITIILNTTFLLFPSLLSFIPLTLQTVFVLDGYGFYNLFIFTVRGSGGLRAQSIFWEPGAWAFNQAFAAFWMLYINKDTKRFPIMLISMFLTFSTTGIALIVLLLLNSFIFSKDKKYKRSIGRTVVIIGALLSVAIVYVNANFNIDILQLLNDQLFGKFTGAESTALSYQQRTEATAKAFSIALANPVFGIGKMNEDNTLFVTSSISEVCYQLGLIYLVTYIIVFRRIFKPLGLVLSIAFCMIMINGEAYSFMILSSLILIYGAKLYMAIEPSPPKIMYPQPVEV